MNEIISVKTPGRRRHYSADFKAQIVAACNQPDASVADVAQANSLNVSMVHRWCQLARDQAIAEPTVPDFMPVALQEYSLPATADVLVALEVGSIKVHWPLSHIDQSIAWLRQLQS